MVKIPEKISSKEQLFKSIKHNSHKWYYGTDENGLVDWRDSKNGLFVGGMGSGKSIAAFATVAFHTISNPQGIVFIVDELKGAMDFTSLYGYKRVIPLANDSRYVDSVIKMIYREMVYRQGQSFKNPEQNFSPITLSIENSHSLCGRLHFQTNHSSPNSLAYKLKMLVEIGNRYGITILFIAQRSCQQDMPEELLKNIPNVCAFFNYDTSSANYLTLPDSISFSSQNRGKAATYEGIRQFTYISEDDIRKIVTEEIIDPNNDLPPKLLSVSSNVLESIKKDPNYILNMYQTMAEEAEMDDDIEFWDFVAKA